jgi:hypothetical protein
MPEMTNKTHENNFTLNCKLLFSRAVPYLRNLVADFAPRRQGFDLSSGHVGFVVDTVFIIIIIIIWTMRL